MMKTILLTLTFFTTLNSYSQTYYPLGNDTNGDCACACMDIASFDYAFDIALDSVWFKITTNNNRNANYGYHIVVDRDNNFTNGDSWSGTSTGSCSGFMNFNMNHDRMIAAWPSLNFVEAYDGTGGTILHYSVLKKLISPTVTVIGVKLSEVDSDMDGIFNVILGLGDEYYVNHDAFPNTGYITTSFTSVKNNLKSLDAINFFPNPVSSTLNIESAYTTKFYVADMNGKIIYSKNTVRKVESIDVSNFENGIYLIFTEKGVSKLIILH